MYSIPLERMALKNFHFTYKPPNKTAFFVDITLQEVGFYIITPEEYEKIIVEKCTNTWPKATIQKISSFPIFSKQAVKYEMIYKRGRNSSKKHKRYYRIINIYFNIYKHYVYKNSVSDIYENTNRSSSKRSRGNNGNFKNVGKGRQDNKNKAIVNGAKKLFEEEGYNHGNCSEDGASAQPCS